MAQFNHRINLKKSDMPLLSSELGQTVLVSNDRNTPTGEDSNPPEIVYMHNVMPTKRGMQSVGFKDLIPAPTGGDATTSIDGILLVPSYYDNVLARWDSTISIYGCIATNTTFYLARDDVAVWIKDPAIAGTAVQNKISVGFAQGQSYIYTIFKPYRVEMEGDLPGYTPSLALVAFIGMPILSLGGIASSSAGQLIAWNELGQVAWSSLLDPLDFAPSAITGAGFATIEGVRGGITEVKGNSTGFIIYAEYNIVAATYTGNKQFPYKFKPIEGSSGVRESEVELLPPGNAASFNRGLIADNSIESSTQIAYTEAGLASIQPNKASLLLPELTDFFGEKTLEDFDELTKSLSLTTTVSGAPLNKRVNYIANRYIVISYGLTELTHAFIYDLHLNRMGKIRYTHVKSFEHTSRILTPITLTTASYEYRESSKEVIALLDKTGKVVLVSFNSVDTTRNGVLILGKYQYTRDRMLHLQSVTTENVDAADTFSFTDSVSLNGVNESSQVTGTETAGTVGYREYYLDAPGRNHSLIFIGSFILNSIKLLFTIGGRS